MRPLLLAALCGLTLASAACKKPEPKLTREQVMPALQQEAARMKSDGESMPDVGVKATWTIVGVEVQEQPGNDAKPFKGTVRFKIESTAHALSGQSPQSFEKRFDYVYDAAQKKWLFGG
jgi:hypothetical protein